MTPPPLPSPQRQSPIRRYSSNNNNNNKSNDSRTIPIVQPPQPPLMQQQQQQQQERYYPDAVLYSLLCPCCCCWYHTIMGRIAAVISTTIASINVVRRYKRSSNSYSSTCSSWKNNNSSSSSNNRHSCFSCCSISRCRCINHRNDRKGGGGNKRNRSMLVWITIILIVLILVVIISVTSIYMINIDTVLLQQQQSKRNSVLLLLDILPRKQQQDDTILQYSDNNNDEFPIIDTTVLPVYTNMNQFVPTKYSSSSSGSSGTMNHPSTATTFTTDHFQYQILQPQSQLQLQLQQQSSIIIIDEDDRTEHMNQVDQTNNNNNNNNIRTTISTRIRSFLFPYWNQNRQQQQQQQYPKLFWHVDSNNNNNITQYVSAASLISLLASSSSTTTEQHVVDSSSSNSNNNNRYDTTTATTSSVNMKRSSRTSNRNQPNHTATDTVCHFICQFHIRSVGYTHFPHFYQQLLPCLSMFDYLTTKSTYVTTTTTNYNRSSSSHSHQQQLHYTIVLPDSLEVIKSFPSYIQSLIDALQQYHTYHIQFVYGFENVYTIPVPESCYSSYTSSSSTTLSSLLTPIAIMAIKVFHDTGWDHPSRYFLSSLSAADNTKGRDNQYNLYNVITELQKSVLQNDYRSGPSTFEIDTNTAMNNDHSSSNNIMNSNIQHRVIQVLVLDRKQSLRDFVHVNVMITELRQYVYYCTITNVSYRMNVTYIATFTSYTLYEQARVFHTADIIFSPHGAQLSNSIYIRPCTVVVEFFPKDYYMQFFQSLVVNANGISYESYPSSYQNVTCNKITDTQMALQNKTTSTARKARIYITSQFFRNTNNNSNISNDNIQQLIDTSIQCRTNYKG